MKTILERYMSIPIYPQSKRDTVLAPNCPIIAPICEDDKGKLSFLSEEAKARFIDIYKKGKGKINDYSFS